MENNLSSNNNNNSNNNHSNTVDDSKEDRDAVLSGITGTDNGSQNYEEVDPFTRRSALVRTPPDKGEVTLTDGRELMDIMRTKVGSSRDNTKRITPMRPRETLLSQTNQHLLQENQVKTQKELEYYNAWQAELAAKNMLQQTIEQLIKEVKILKAELEEFKNRPSTRPQEREKPLSNDLQECKIDYCTDEDELEQEISRHQSGTKPKKRKAKNSPEILMKKSSVKPAQNESTTSQQKYETDEEELASEVAWVTAGNRKNKKKRKVSQLPGSSPEQQTRKQLHQTKAKEKKEPHPPPIIVSNVTDYDSLYTALTGRSILFKATALNNDQVKINTEERSAFKSTLDCLHERGMQWHSYEDKQTRNIKVMVRGLPPTASPLKIINELRQRNLACVNATNIIKKEKIEIRKGEIEIVKKPLPLFMLSFNHSEEIKVIYEIKDILGMKIRIEPLRKTNLIPQCKRCQLYGHTHNFCNRQPKCVKCAGKHLTAECRKSPNEKPKCANCKLEHPANYRGCEVAVTFQAMRDKITQKKSNKSVEKKLVKTDEKKLVKTYPQVRKEITYAQSVNSSNQLTTPQKAEISTNELLLTLIAKLDKQEELLDSFSARLQKLENNTKPIAPTIKNAKQRY